MMKKLENYTPQVPLLMGKLDLNSASNGKTTSQLSFLMGNLLFNCHFSWKNYYSIVISHGKTTQLLLLLGKLLFNCHFLFEGSSMAAFHRITTPKCYFS